MASDQIKPISGNTQPSYSHNGFCPICEQHVTFSSEQAWYRDHLLCPSCPNGSVPRERALMLSLRHTFPNWQSLDIHESSPIARGASVILSQQAASYIPTQYYPSYPLGINVNHVRNENLEAQTFPDGTFDLVISLDVMEHVNMPSQAFQEIARTLKPNGAYIFTAPTYKAKVNTERRARYLEDGRIEHLAPPEYHGNPVSDQGALVTFHYGYDLPELIHQWSGLSVRVERFWDPYHGIIGEFTEVYVCCKNHK